MIVVLLMYLIGSSLVNKVYDVQLAEFPIPSGQWLLREANTWSRASAFVWSATEIISQGAYSRMTHFSGS